jgi:hypothetical protein
MYEKAARKILVKLEVLPSLWGRPGAYPRVEHLVLQVSPEATRLKHISGAPL